jgi:hypothetical protein
MKKTEGVQLCPFCWRVFVSVNDMYALGNWKYAHVLCRNKVVEKTACGHNGGCYNKGTIN